MKTNLFPAILLAGPPHCGKSVLAFLLTNHLRELGIAHYLLRAAPDGEGDWFLKGQPEVVQTLRAVHKRQFSSEFILHMHAAIENRLLPMLVDIGGRPQGEQIGLIRACTHFILLYRTRDQKKEWQSLLKETSLLPVAELHSVLGQDEIIYSDKPFLHGLINGLDRSLDQRKTGITFGFLLERVSGICSYDAIVLEQVHLKHAPFQVINERELANQIAVPVEGEKTIWSPVHLKRIPEFVPTSKPLAIYGRGPVWLAAVLAVRSRPEGFAIFDARYGWLFPPPIRIDDQYANLRVNSQPYQTGNTWIEFELASGTLEPDEVALNPLPTEGGLVLSGKIPRWLFATLAHKLASHHAWIAVNDPHLTRAVIVHSNSSTLLPGDTLPRVNEPRDYHF